MEKVVQYYQQQDFTKALNRLKKIYLHQQSSPELYLFFFLNYRALKEKKKAFFWLKQGFYQYPEEVRLAESYAYYTLRWKKDFQEALEPLSTLARLTKNEPFTDYLLSQFYYKKNEPEKALLFAKAAIIHGKDKLFRRWYYFLLYNYKMNYLLEKYQRSYFVRYLTGKFIPADEKKIKNNFNKFRFFKATGIIKLDQYSLSYPLMLYQWGRQYNLFLPDQSLLSLVQQAQEKGVSLLFKDSGKKKAKKPGLLDENLIRIIALIALLATLLYLFGGDF